MINFHCFDLRYFTKSLKLRLRKGIYTGEIDDNGLKEGNGILRFHNGNIFEGEFRNDRPNGKGTRTYSSGTVITGQFHA